MSKNFFKLVSLATIAFIGVPSAVAGNFDGSSTSGLWSKQYQLEDRQSSIEKRLQRIEQRQSQGPQYSPEFLRRFGKAPASNVATKAKVNTGKATAKKISSAKTTVKKTASAQASVSKTVPTAR